MKKMHYEFKIVYEVIGSKKAEVITMVAENFAEAIKKFTEVKFNVKGFEFTYNESAIINISKTNWSATY